MAEYVTQSVVVLVLPAVLSPQAFGMYRQVLAYSAVAGLFHFGLLNGYYKRISSSLDGNSVCSRDRAVRKMLLLILAIISAPVCTTAVLINDDWESRFVIFAIVLNIGLLNFQTFHHYTWMARSKMRPYVAVSLLSKIALIGAVLLVGVVESFSPISVVYVLLGPLLMSVLIYEIIWRSHSANLGACNLGDSIFDIKSGWPILKVSAQIGLACAFDKILISSVAPREVFSSYALAFSVSGFFAIAADATANVIAPYFLRTSFKTAEKTIIRKFQISIVWLAGASCFITQFVVATIFPTYSKAGEFALVAGLYAPIIVFLKSYVSPRLLIEEGARKAQKVVGICTLSVLSVSVVAWEVTNSVLQTGAVCLVVLLFMALAIAYKLSDDLETRRERFVSNLNLVACLGAILVSAQINSPKIGMLSYGLIAGASICVQLRRASLVAR